MSDDVTERRYDRNEMSAVPHRAAEAKRGAGDSGDASPHDATLAGDSGLPNYNAWPRRQTSLQAALGGGLPGQRACAHVSARDR
jgi:hypothetical protein